MAVRYLAQRRDKVYLAEWLEYLDVRPTELARRMETDKANVSRWQSEPSRITLDVLSGIALALGLPNAGPLFQPPRQYQAQQDIMNSVRAIAETTKPHQSPRR